MSTLSYKLQGRHHDSSTEGQSLGVKIKPDPGKEDIAGLKYPDDAIFSDVEPDSGSDYSQFKNDATATESEPEASDSDLNVPGQCLNSTSKKRKAKWSQKTSHKKLAAHKSAIKLHQNPSTIDGIHNLTAAELGYEQTEIAQAGEISKVNPQNRGDRTLVNLALSAPAEHREAALADKDRWWPMLKCITGVQGKKAWRLEEETGKFYIQGIQDALYLHQMEAVGFMRYREKHGMAARGRGTKSEDTAPCGMICHLPGMGKTRMILITSYLTYLSKQKGHTTLIVVPANLVGQWYDEAKSLYGTEREDIVIFDEWDDLNTIGNNFIVLASYEHFDKPECRTKMLEIDWFRVVFDEGHFIRTRSGKRFEAAVRIKAPRRWIMTGTPIINSKDEIYSYCKILHIECPDTIQQWHKEFCRDDEGKAKLNKLLSSMMLQRY
jgi:hypothetical protein